jgi:hypothetical protein
MKKLIFLLMSLLAFISHAEHLKAQGLKWDESYSFDKCNIFKMEFYAKGNELMRTVQYKTYYQSDGENFVVKLVTDRKGSGTETLRLWALGEAAHRFIMQVVTNTRPNRK